MKWLFIATMLSGVMMFGLYLYFWETSPTVPDITSGKVYPQFDKLHLRYVYLTKAENNSLPFLICVGGACLVSYVFIDLRMKKLGAQSAQEREQGPDSDQDE
jgi:hypothetical protein